MFSERGLRPPFGPVRGAGEGKEPSSPGGPHAERVARFPSFTEAEALAWRTFERLGDAARRGLHLSERVAARETQRAARAAYALRSRLEKRQP